MFLCNNPVIQARPRIVECFIGLITIERDSRLDWKRLQKQISLDVTFTQSTWSEVAGNRLGSRLSRSHKSEEQTKLKICSISLYVCVYIYIYNCIYIFVYYIYIDSIYIYIYIQIHMYIHIYILYIVWT